MAAANAEEENDAADGGGGQVVKRSRKSRTPRRWASGRPVLNFYPRPDEDPTKFWGADGTPTDFRDFMIVMRMNGAIVRAALGMPDQWTSGALHVGNAFGCPLAAKAHARVQDTLMGVPEGTTRVLTCRWRRRLYSHRGGAAGHIERRGGRHWHLLYVLARTSLDWVDMFPGGLRDHGGHHPVVELVCIPAGA